MTIFKKKWKNLEGATRGQSFVWEVYGIFWSNLPPLVFGMLAVNSECGFFTIGVLVCFKTIVKEKLKYLEPISKQPQLFENPFIWCSVFTRIAKTDPWLSTKGQCTLGFKWSQVQINSMSCITSSGTKIIEGHKLLLYEV